MPIVVGQTLGQYHIQEKIGAGGMGVVYKAEQTAVNRVVVIKVLTADFATDPGALGRFKREVDIIAQLEHPYILPLYDFGQVDNNPYIVMRYMRGGSFFDRLRARNLTQEQRLRILEQIAEALDYAHDRDIIHRDLKPANILLDEHGNACLADFGLAKTMEGTLDLTQTGSVLGTPAYMSPEQARGEKLDRRSDLYAFAVLTYETLGGRLPFVGNTTWEYIQKHLVETPPSILSIAPQLPAALDGVLGAGLAKDREQRPARATDFIRSVRAVLGSADASGAGPAPADYRPATLHSRAATSGVARSAAAAERSAAPAAPAPSAIAWALPAFGVVLGGGLILAAIVAVIVFAILQGNLLGQKGPQASTYPVGKSPRALLFDGAAVWVANTSSDTVIRLSATACEASPDPCGQVLGTYPVDTLPMALAFDGEAVWVASALNSKLTLLDPGTGQALAHYQLQSVPGSLIFAGGSMWAADSITGALTRIGLDGTLLGGYTLGQHPVALAFDGQHLWTANPDEASLTEFDPASGEVLQTVQVDGQPQAVAFDGERLWAALGDQDKVVSINPAEGTVTAQVSVGRRPVALLFDGATLWSANQKSNTVTRIDVAQAKSVATLSAPGGPYALAWAPCGASCGDLWIAGEANSTVSRIRIQP